LGVEQEVSLLVAVAVTMAAAALFEDGTIVLSVHRSLGEDKAGENEL